MTTKPVISIKGLSKSFPGKKLIFSKRVSVLKDISFNVYREVFGFIGPNGAGKTTTMKLILGFLKPDSGTIRIFGKPNSDVSVKRRIGFLPENAYVYRSITALEYLHFCADSFGVPYRERKEKFKALLSLVDLIGNEDKRISAYSKGMTQRLLFASALVNDPELLILDEPMSGLDPIGRNIIASAIVSLKEKGKTVFYSSHIIQDVERLSDRVGIIVNGEMKLVDSVASIVGSYITGYRISYKELGDSSVLQKEVSRDNLYSEIENIKSKKATVISIEPKRASLEDIFMKIIEGKGERISNSEVNL